MGHYGSERKITDPQRESSRGKVKDCQRAKHMGYTATGKANKEFAKKYARQGGVMAKTGRPRGTYKDLTGEKYNMLTVLERVPGTEKRTLWLCKCDCGKTTIARADKLRTNRKKSCGCLWKTIGKYTNGKVQSKLDGVLRQLKQRCNNPNNKDYRYYGAIGIQVCEEWQHARDFERWALANGYKDGLTIDRIDGSGNYEPGNCHFITAKENCSKQPNKRRKSHEIHHPHHLPLNC